MTTSGCSNPAAPATTATGTTTRHALVRLQRILLLRDLGLGLPAIAEVLGHEPDAEQALGRHLEWLRQEQDRLARQIASVRQTIEAVKGGGEIMAEEMFDGFDHTQYKDEVEQRWGKDAYAKGDAWWRGMGAEEKDAWKQRSRQLGSDWIAAAAVGRRGGQRRGAGPGPAAGRMAHRDSRDAGVGRRQRAAAAISRGTSPASARCTLPIPLRRELRRRGRGGLRPGRPADLRRSEHL